MSGKLARQCLSASQEAIAYQKESPLFRDLTIAFERAVSTKMTSRRAFKELNIDAIIKRHTGLTVDVGLDPDAGVVNAYAVPIILDPNNPFMQRIIDLGYGEYVEDWTTTEKKILPLTKDLRGSLDLHRSRVTGVFSKIPTELRMGDGLWNYADMTAEEVAAVCLHEIGHIFTFFEMILHTTTMNLTLTAAKADINKMPAKEQRIQLVHKVAESLDVQIENPEKLADPRTSDQEFAAIFCSAYSNGRVNNTTRNGGRYDLRSSEVAADQWASRHGATLALATGLYKFDRGSLTIAPIWVQASVDVLHKLLVVGTFVGALSAAPAVSAVIGIMFLGYLGVADPEFRIYDDPKERIVRIRHDAIQILKSNLYDAETRKRLVTAIKQLEPIIAKMHDYRSLMNRLWIFIGSNRRANYKQMRLEQELEKISNNNLFVAAAQMQNHAEGVA